MKRLLCLALIMLSAGFSCPQNEAVAKVYVYQLKHVKTLGRVAPPVHLDDKEIAKLDGERFFVVRLSPGKHTFRLKDKKRGGIEMEFKAGETYYVRMEMREGATVGPAGLTLVPIENAAYELKQMKPIKPKDIKDQSLVRGN